MKTTTKPRLYGVMAQFDSPSALVAAARETYTAGYRRINGYSPFPIEELSEAIGFKRTSLPLIVLIGGIIGALGGFFDRLSNHCRRQALQQLAGLHSDHL